MIVENIKTVEEYKAFVAMTANSDREALIKEKRSGFYWTAYQYDEKNQKAEILMQRVKNYTLANMYVIVGIVLQNFATQTAVSSGGTALNGETSGTTGIVYGVNGTSTNSASVFMNGAAGFGLKLVAGTDTSTTSTPTMSACVTPASPSPYATASLNYSASTQGLTITATWGIGAFGAGGSTNIGEFVLELSSGSYDIGVNRLAVADGNASFTSPITVNNAASFTITIVLVM